MENNDYRPHLLIPDGEVDHVENKPFMPPKNLGLDRAEHGDVLSAGLQEILSAYDKYQSGDSLSDADIRIFEIVLPEGEKLKDHKSLLEKEGMTIHQVRDDRHGVVSTTLDKFSALQGRIKDYRDGTHKYNDFQFIEGFNSVNPLDKQAKALRELLDSLGANDMTLDVQIMIMPKIGAELQAAAENKLIQNINDNEGRVIHKPYKLSDNTPVVRAKLTAPALKAVAADTGVCRITQTAVFSLFPAYTIDAQTPITLDQNVNVDELPIIAILDDGVQFPAALDNVIVAHWFPQGHTGGDGKHGTSVASKAAFADVGEQLVGGVMSPRARILDCNICDEESLTDEELILRIREAVMTFHESVKIYNLSMAGKMPIDGDNISLLGYELDVLSNTYEVKFTIATGNHELYMSQTSLDEILDDDDARIALPADSMLNISVGAIVGQTHKGSLSQMHDVAPYSRIGPGFLNFRKPNMVHYAGTKLANTTHSPPDPYAMMLAPNGKWSFDAGTSFTAPIIAGDLAEIMRTVPDGNILMAEALLYHAAAMPFDVSARWKNVENMSEFIGNLYGIGIPQKYESMYSSAHRVTFIHHGSLAKKDKQRVRFLMPKVFEEELNMRKKGKKARVTVTCVTQPPIDNTKGRDYLGAFIEASLHGRNGNGTAMTANPSDADCRKKGDTFYHFYQDFSSFTGGNDRERAWEIWLQLHTNWDVDSTQKVEYALAVTIEDLTKSFDIYNEVIVESQGRFKPVELVRVPIRQ